MKQNPSLPRRKFIKQAALIAGAPMILPASVLGLNGRTPPSERITVGGIGLGPRGRSVLKAFLPNNDCQFLAIADPQVERANIVKRLVDRHYQNADCTTSQDMGEILSRDDIDAVIIATGDRWHTTASVYAARAGKDIYCEKPCAMNIQEAIELDEAVQKHQRVFQAGTQRRNVPNFALAAELAQSGQLGKLTAVHAGIIELSEYKEPLPAQPTPGPAVIDWNRWVGPAPMLAYNEDYCRGRWRGHKGLYAAYTLPEWGAHTIDLCQWAAGMDGTAPIEYECEGTTITARYANGIKLVMRIAGFNGEGDWIEGIGTCPVRFEGENGWAEAGDYKQLHVSEPELIEGRQFDQLSGTKANLHVRDFLNCVKTREQPACNSRNTRYGHLACFAAAASWKTGTKIHFDPENPQLPDHDASNSLQSYTRREGFTI